MKNISERLLIAHPYIFAFLYFILLMFIETSTLYAFQNKSFLLSDIYLKPYLLYSGGIIDYWALLFSEILDFNLAGAIMYASLLLLSILLYQRVIIKIGATKNLILITLLPFLFIYLLTFDHFHPIAYNLKLIISLIFLNAIVSIPYQNIISKGLITVILVLLWYLVGMEFFIISLFHVFILSIKNRSYKKDLFVILLSALSVLFLNTYVFYTPFLSFKKNILAYESRFSILPLITYVILILIPVAAIIRMNRSLNTILQFGIVLLVAVPLGIFSFDKVNHYIGKIMAAGNKGNFKKVLAIRDNTSINTRLISAYTNMALLNEGTLLTNMFKYRQNGGIDGLFPSRDFDNFTAYINMKISFEIGSINSTIRWAMEASTYMGYNTEIVRHLILCHLINDNVKAAEKYYSVLKRTVFHRKLKNEMCMTIRNYKCGKPDEIIIKKRESRSLMDYFSNNGNSPAKFEWVLQQSDNPRAIEFYTGLCLLNNDFYRLKGIITKMKDLGYTSLPIHFQEAICLFYFEYDTPPELSHYVIDPEIFQNCKWFLRTIQRYNGNLRAAKQELIQRTGYTYWYYLYYISPVTRKLRS